MRKTFGKAERLCSKKLIDQLFGSGQSHFISPIKFILLPHPDDRIAVHQVLFTVSKRLFKRAVDRNLIKRRLREAYRLNKHLLQSSRKYMIAYIYVVKEILPSSTIHEKMALSFRKIMEHEVQS